jgi:pimeloyl-ACP methyl ester carboxylesterase
VPPRRPLPSAPGPASAAAPRSGGGGALGWVGAALVYSGAALVGASIYQGQRTRAAEANHPPVGRFIETDGTVLHYVDIGEGPPIVLLHGIGSTLDDWFVSGVIDRLLPHHRIIAIDRPGYGYSRRPGGIRWTPERQARAIARMLHRLGAHEATVVAHSFGVLPAMALAIQHPTFARSLVLIGGVYLPGSFLGRLSRAVPSVPLLGSLARGAVSPSLARAALPSLVRSMFEPQPVTSTFRERFSIDFATRPGQLRAASEDLGEIEPATRRFLPHYGELTTPVAVVTGSGDAIFDPDLQSRPFAARVPGASLVVIPAGGHLVHHTSPDAVTEVILDTAAGWLSPSDIGPPPDADAGPLDDAPPAAGAEGTPSGAADDAALRLAALEERERAAAEREKALAERERALGGRDAAESDAGNTRATRSRQSADEAEPEVSGAARAATAEHQSRTSGTGSAAASAADAGEDASDDDGDDASVPGDNDGSSVEAGEHPAPKRRRTRSRRKTA